MAVSIRRAQAAALPIQKGTMMPLNLFLLFHKCGNHYVKEVHEHSKVDFLPSVNPSGASRIRGHDRKDAIVNVRCRNFSYGTLAESDLLGDRDIRYMVFTRHPASFILSAVKYHMRGLEKWARSTPQPHFDGKTLTYMLRHAETEAERQIHIMNHFDYLYQRQASFSRFFDDPRVLQVKTEDLFSATDDEFYKEMARFLRLGNSPEFVDSLKNASPAYKQELPKHSTGEFRVRDPYRELEGEARDFYDGHFAIYAKQLGY